MKKLTRDEIDRLPVPERFKVCTCEFGVPSPSWVDPDCPLHWELSDGRGGVKEEVPQEAVAPSQMTLDDLRDLFEVDGLEYTVLYKVPLEGLPNDRLKILFHDAREIFEEICAIVEFP